MILKLNGADFSANNIGNVPVEINLLPYTEAAISASGNALMTDLQKVKLDNFFRTLGAGENNSILSKMRKIYLPIIATDVANGFVNYADNTFAKDVTPSSSVWSLRNKGLVASASSPAITLTLSNPLLANNFSQYWLRTEPMEVGVSDSQKVLTLRGKSNSNLFLGAVETSSSSDTVLSWGNYGSNAWGTISKTSITEIKSAAIISRGANDIRENWYGTWRSTTVSSLVDMSSESSQDLYVLGLGSNNTLKPYAVLMIGEAVTNEQGEDICNAIDELWNVFKPNA